MTHNLKSLRTMNDDKASQINTSSTTLPPPAMESANQAAYTRIGDPALLDKIDKLFACNVGEYVNLPQLVVIGDQSSGKSSVLEGLTNLPFPRNSGLCTRFATKITFRRAPVDSVAVSVIPDPAASGEHHQEVKAWRMDNLTALDANSFADIMTRVRSALSDGKANFAGCHVPPNS